MIALGGGAIAGSKVPSIPSNVSLWLFFGGTVTSFIGGALLGGRISKKLSNK